MPARAATICTHSGCHALVRDTSGRCARHPVEAWAKSKARQGTTTERGYGHAWRKLRASILARDRGLCQASLARGLYVPAVTVDHIVCKALWLHLHGTLQGCDEQSNLQSLCKAEHDAKTLREAEQARLERWPVV